MICSKIVNGSACPSRNVSTRRGPIRDTTGAASRQTLTLAQRRVLDVLREGGGYASYERLIEELWCYGPDEPANAIGALHCLLSRMRKVLGHQAIRTWHGQGVRLDAAGFRD